MNRLIVSAIAAGVAGLAAPSGFAEDAGPDASLRAIDTVVVIYAENRSFDNLFGTEPGAEGLADASETSKTQLDRDGTVLKELPPVWNGLTAKGVTPAVIQAQTEHLPNRPFEMDDPKGFNVSLGTITQDLWHRFYQNQMQIDGGKNDKF